MRKFRDVLLVWYGSDGSYHQRWMPVVKSWSLLLSKMEEGEFWGILPHPFPVVHRAELAELAGRSPRDVEGAGPSPPVAWWKDLDLDRFGITPVFQCCKDPIHTNLPVYRTAPDRVVRSHAWGAVAVQLALHVAEILRRELLS